MKFMVEADSVAELIAALQQLIAANQPATQLLGKQAGTPLMNLMPTVRVENCLKAAGIYTIEELKETFDRHPLTLLGIPNFGRKSLNEVRELLEEYSAKTQLHQQKKEQA